MNNQYAMYTHPQGSIQRFNPTASNQLHGGMEANLRPDGMSVGPVAIPPEKLAQMFFEIVKKGDLNEIKSFLGNLVVNWLVKNNMDPSKLIDSNLRHTCLFYATLIKDPHK